MHSESGINHIIVRNSALSERDENMINLYKCASQAYRAALTYISHVSLFAFKGPLVLICSSTARSTYKTVFEARY